MRVMTRRNIHTGSGYCRMIALVVALAASSQAAFPCADVSSCAAQPWYHIPGPNPLITPGPDPWDSGEIETGGGVQKINGEL
jgi:hypothetical protein